MKKVSEWLTGVSQQIGFVAEEEAKREPTAVDEQDRDGGKAAETETGTATEVDSGRERYLHLSDANIAAFEETAKAVADQFYTLTSKFFNTSVEQGMELKSLIMNKTILGSFEMEQEKFRRELESKALLAGQEAAAPWDDCACVTDARKQMLSLSFDSRNFLRDPPAGSDFSFDYTAFSGLAKAALKHDPLLCAMRFELVPKRTSEEKFWRNYFYRVSLIKNNVNARVKDLTGKIEAEAEAKIEAKRLDEPASSSVCATTADRRQDKQEADQDCEEVSDEKIDEIEREVLANLNEFELVDRQEDPLEEADWDSVVAEALVSKSPASSPDVS